jgi:uncharacterized protein (DUF3820 family)
VKYRSYGFLSESQIDHKGEIFDYINELHEYLWRFVRLGFPNASGELGYYLDMALNIFEQRKDLKIDSKMKKEYF